MTYVTLFETNKQTCHTDPNLETYHNALVEISPVSNIENVVFVTCHMSLIVFREIYSHNHWLIIEPPICTQYVSTHQTGIYIDFGSLVSVQGLVGSLKFKFP